MICENLCDLWEKISAECRRNIDGDKSPTDYTDYTDLVVKVEKIREIREINSSLKFEYMATRP